MARKDEGLWSHKEGQKPNQVVAFERALGGPLYLRAWDPTMGAHGGYRKQSLGHRDRKKAITEARREAAKLEEGNQAIREEKITLARLFTLYQRHRTPQKGMKEQREDERRLQMWTRVLGAHKDPQGISRQEWERFIRERGSGTIDAQGKSVPEDKRGAVGSRSVERDLKFLLATLNWGRDWRGERGYLLKENCCRGYPMPRERNPRRPIASDERVQKVRDVAPLVTMDVNWYGNREAVPSHLALIFELAVETGRRLGSIVKLQYSDLLLDRGPHGMIRWRAATDKQRRESVVPISPSLRCTLDQLLRERPGIGDAPIFPSPKDPCVPVDVFSPDRWLREAEKLAGLEPQEGGLWHPFRRRWSTVRKSLSAVDVAAAGGWAGPHTLQTVYQRADEETMYEVVVGGGELREAKGS